MSHNSLHVPGGRELWLTTTLCLYGIYRQVGYILHSHIYIYFDMQTAVFVASHSKNSTSFISLSPALSCVD